MLVAVIGSGVPVIGVSVVVSNVCLNIFTGSNCLKLNNLLKN